MKRFLVAMMIVAALVPATSSAIPLLQLYIEGATYQGSTQTWVTTSSSFRLWVIANVSGPGGSGGVGIEDVRLATAFLTSESGTISLTATTTGLVTDPSTPSAPTVMLGLGADGTQPEMSDGGLLPTHGIYGAGTSFTQYSLGNMLSTDSPIADFGGPIFPGSFTANRAQINAYDVVVTGYTQVHFDAFNHVVGETHSKFAPFSHDAGGTPTPEPGTVLLLGSGIFAAASAGFRRRKSR